MANLGERDRVRQKGRESDKDRSRECIKFSYLQTKKALVLDYQLKNTKLPFESLLFRQTRRLQPQMAITVNKALSSASL